MSTRRVGLSPDEFGIAFPFHLSFDQGMTIQQVGPALTRLCPDIVPGSQVNDHFRVKRPEITLDFSSVVGKKGQLFLLQTKDGTKTFRGQMLPVEDGEQVAFLCSPWLTEMADVKKLGLSLGDFAIHDPVADFLFLLQAKNTALNDATKLANRLTTQRAELRALNRRLTTLYAISELLLEVERVEEAAEQVLKRLCDAFDWPFGAIWLRHDSIQGLLCEASYGGNEAQSLLAAQVRQLIATSTEGLPGQVFATGEPLWLASLEAGAPTPEMMMAVDSGLRSGCGFVVRSGDEIMGVIALFHTEERQQDPGMVELGVEVGRKLGQFIEFWEAETVLREAKEAAEEANRAKSTFLANMSHELRTPLTAIIGYSEMWQETAAESGDELLVEDLGKIHDSGIHLLRLINDVLDLSKIEAGKMDLFPEMCDIPLLVDSVAAAVHPAIAKNNNRLEVVCERTFGSMRVDVTRLRQILFNLLSNAAKFTEQGMIMLTVRHEEVDGQPVVAFEVADSGIGMTATQMEMLFQAFMQVDASPTRRFGGTGLGLALSRHFSRMMGGDIEVRSEPGQGSVFTLRLPLGEVRRLPHGSLTLLGDPASIRVSGMHNENPVVLVIDDDATMRDLLSRTLLGEGFQVVTASSGVEGLALAASIHPAVVTLDVLMPDMDGWTVLNAFQADPALASIPVVMVTMLNDQGIGYALGAAAYLTKPVARDQLIATLQRYGSSDQRTRILLVEDDPASREMLGRLLRAEGYIVDEAGHGREALAAVEVAVPDLILLDLMMPEMDGFQFLEALREQPEGRAIPVVILTALTLTAEERQRLNGSVVRILQKRLETQQPLRDELRQLLGASLVR